MLAFYMPSGLLDGDGCHHLAGISNPFAPSYAYKDITPESKDLMDPTLDRSLLPVKDGTMYQPVGTTTLPAGTTYLPAGTTYVPVGTKMCLEKAASACLNLNTKSQQH
nr:hypothetical protein [Tanacetum cinerariifolium]